MVADAVRAQSGQQLLATLSYQRYSLSLDWLLFPAPIPSYFGLGCRRDQSLGFYRNAFPHNVRFSLSDLSWLLTQMSLASILEKDSFIFLNTCVIVALAKTGDSSVMQISTRKES